MLQTIWLAFPSLTSLLILFWLFLRSEKRAILGKNWPIQLLFAGLFCICLIEFFTYTHLLSPSITLMKLFYVSCFIGLTGILSQSIKIANTALCNNRCIFKFLIYICVTLSVLMIGTNLFIDGIEYISYSYTRIPGNLYFLVQIYLISTMLLTLYFLFVGARFSNDRKNSAKAKVLLNSISPILIFATILVLLMQLNFKINASIAFPLCITYFLLILMHIEKEKSLFALLMKLPFSKERKSINQISEEIQKFIIEAEISQNNTNKSLDFSADNPNISLKALTKTIENIIVNHAVDITQGSQIQAASLLGISSSSICRKKRIAD